MKQLKILMVTLLSLLVLTGCLGQMQPTQPIGDTGSLAVLAALPANMDPLPARVELILRQDSRELRFDVPLHENTATMSVESLYEGEWQAILQTIDAEGHVTHQATNSVLIFGQQSSMVEFDLVPAPGILEVYIDLTSFADNDRVGRARITVNPGGYSSSIREEGSDIIRIEREVDPQTYDFRVTLYGETYTGAIYNSPWTPVTISPGRVTTVRWTPSTGDLIISGTLRQTPDKPEGFRVESIGGDQIKFSWFPGIGSEHAVGYRIYERDTPFGYFKAIKDVPFDTYEYVLDVSKVPAGTTRAYAIAAFSELGLEGPRTDYVSVTFPPTSGSS